MAGAEATSRIVLVGRPRQFHRLAHDRRRQHGHTVTAYAVGVYDHRAVPCSGKNSSRRRSGGACASTGGVVDVLPRRRVVPDSEVMYAGPPRRLPGRDRTVVLSAGPPGLRYSGGGPAAAAPDQ